MAVKNQKITDQYAIYNSDCMEVLPELKDASVDLSVYSPPFAGLFNYSSSDNDFSNCTTKEQFLNQYEFLIKEISRVTKPGRITAVHCTDIISGSSDRMWDFPHEIIRLHAKYGFLYRNRITIWKEPLKVRMRTMVQSLMHKFIVEDSAETFPAMPDYVLVFRKTGKNEVPITHAQGLSRYAGSMPLLLDHLHGYGIKIPRIDPIDDDLGRGIEEYIQTSFRELQKRYAGWEDQKTNKLSHIIWQRYASSVWDDIRIDNVLEYKKARDPEDEKHCHPLQLDVIDRCVTLWSNRGETVLTPFMGVGSEVYGAIQLGRRAIGVELKESYFNQAVKNLEGVKEITEENLESDSAFI